MALSNIAVTQTTAGLIRAEVVERIRLSPSFVRIRLGGGDLERVVPAGFDHWVRLVLPVADASGLERMPGSFDIAGYARYMAIPATSRPVVRNYTLARVGDGEVDIDFVVHGDAGVAAPWAREALAGDRVGMIDQGAGFRAVPSDWTLLVGDETAAPAVLGILRDLPRDATGAAVIEVPHADDIQPDAGPDGMDLHWVVRRPDARPGATALEHVRELPWRDGTPYAFAAGESKLATGVRRWLVGERGVPKGNVTFCGYWKLGGH